MHECVWRVCARGVRVMLPACVWGAARGCRVQSGAGRGSAVYGSQCACAPASSAHARVRRVHSRGVGSVWSEKVGLWKREAQNFIHETDRTSRSMWVGSFQVIAVSEAIEVFQAIEASEVIEVVKA